MPARPDPAWFCLWEGWGSLWSQSHSALGGGPEDPEEARRHRAQGLARDAVLRATARVEAQARAWFLFRGPLAAACAFVIDGPEQPPSLWWPDDRSWIVVTEIDGYSTYVGGSHDAIRDLVASEVIEAIPVTLDTRIDPGPYR